MCGGGGSAKDQIDTASCVGHRHSTSNHQGLYSQKAITEQTWLKTNNAAIHNLIKLFLQTGNGTDSLRPWVIIYTLCWLTALPVTLKWWQFYHPELCPYLFTSNNYSHPLKTLLSLKSSCCQTLPLPTLLCKYVTFIHRFLKQFRTWHKLSPIPNASLSSWPVSFNLEVSQTVLKGLRSHFQ